MNIKDQALLAKKSSRKLKTLNTEKKNQALKLIANQLKKNCEEIIEANEVDIDKAKEAGVGTMIDRLQITKERLDAIISDILNVISLEDPIGKIIDEKERENGLLIKRVRCPIGVIAEIYESRPNVTVDASVLALKSGNSIILKGGSDAINTNRALVKAIREALSKSDISQDCIQFIDSIDRESVKELLSLNEFIDVAIPRGGKGLIKAVMNNSSIPVIETGASVVHAYIDNEADVSKAIEIVFNSKTQRPSVCNALDTLLVHAEIADDILPNLCKRMGEHNVEIRSCEKSFDLIAANYENVKKAEEIDFDTEFLDYILAVKIVHDLDEALNHIYDHSLMHSECIISENTQKIERFLNEVDAACCFANSSTRFADGGAFGLGAEIGISTQKLHVRGPFALEGLTSYKWIVKGNGQVRK